MDIKIELTIRDLYEDLDPDRIAENVKAFVTANYDTPSITSVWDEAP